MFVSMFATPDNLYVFNLSESDLKELKIKS